MPTLAVASLCTPVFIIAFMIQGFLRVGYDWKRYPVSSLALGPWGWIQRVNFWLTGILVILAAFGIYNASGLVGIPVAIAIAGAGLFGAGLFTTDPIFGYPTDHPLAVAQFTIRGRLHDLVSIFFFLGLVIASGMAAQRFFAVDGAKVWAIYSALSAVCMLITFILAGAGFKQTPSLVRFAGVFQRLSISIGLVWVSLLALHFIA